DVDPFIAAQHPDIEPAGRAALRQGRGGGQSGGQAGGHGGQRASCSHGSFLSQAIEGVAAASGPPACADVNRETVRGSGATDREKTRRWRGRTAETCRAETRRATCERGRQQQRADGPFGRPERAPVCPRARPRARLTRRRSRRTPRKCLARSLSPPYG